MKSCRIIPLLLSVAFFYCSSSIAQDTKPAAKSASPRPFSKHLQWWGEGRFGMFIHWGPVALKETEISWSRANSNPKCPNAGPIPVEVYDNLYKNFNPTKFDAKEWVAIAKAAGMKYMVLTAKHCDGFLLWDSKVSDYNIMNTPFKRDVCKELAEAAHEAGMKLGWYYSPMDWRDPNCRSENNDRFVKEMQAELTELLSNYGKIDLLWFDTDGEPAPWDQAKTYAIIKKLQPDIVINNRLDLQEPGEPTAHQPESIHPNADYYTPEQFIGGFDVQHPWESCMTTSRKNQWSWGGADDGVKPFETCMEMLIGCAGGDGNVLLNVGPTPSGEIAPEQANLVKEMGAWLQKNGESIYGTRGGPFKPGDYGVSTRKGNTIYVHIRNWEADPLRLPAIPAKVLSSRMVTGGKAEVRQTTSGIEISVPEGDRKPIDTIVALELDGDANRIAPIDVPRPIPLSEKAKATASNVFQNISEFDAGNAVDGRSDTRWAADAGVKQAWLELDLGQPKTFRRAKITEAFPNRVQKFELQRMEGSEWKTFYTGTTIGNNWLKSFAPVTAQKVRLNVLEAIDGPTIWEFQLFE
jgi:alpha-L-fucosidase